MRRIGRLLAVLCLNACLGACQPEESPHNPTEAAPAPPHQMVEILGRLLVALCLTALVGGCHPSENSNSDGGSSGDGFPRLDPTPPDQAAQIVAYLRSGKATHPLFPGSAYPPPQTSENGLLGRADG